MARLTRDTDDSLISGEEFRVRRLALQLEQPVVMETLGVTRSTLDKWQSGRVMVPREAREMLEMAEGDVAAMVEDVVVRQIDDIAAIPPHDWPWGDGTWFLTAALARYALTERGVVARIGGGFEPQTPDEQKVAIEGARERLGIVEDEEEDDDADSAAA